jgi:hypothetical protein
MISDGIRLNSVVRELGAATAQQMVDAFLRAEFDSPRFRDRSATGPPPVGPACACAGRPHARSSSLSAAMTRAISGAFVFRITDASSRTAWGTAIASINVAHMPSLRKTGTDREGSPRNSRRPACQVRLRDCSRSCRGRTSCRHMQSCATGHPIPRWRDR